MYRVQVCRSSWSFLLQKGSDGSQKSLKTSVSLYPANKVCTEPEIASRETRQSLDLYLVNDWLEAPSAAVRDGPHKDGRSDTCWHLTAEPDRCARYSASLQRLRLGTIVQRLRGSDCQPKQQFLSRTLGTSSDRMSKSRLDKWLLELCCIHSQWLGLGRDWS